MSCGFAVFYKNRDYLVTGCCSIAKLAYAIISPAVGFAGVRDCAGVPAACCEGFDVYKISAVCVRACGYSVFYKIRGCLVTCCSPIAELAKAAPFQELFSRAFSTIILEAQAVSEGGWMSAQRAASRMASQSLRSVLLRRT